MNISGKFLTPLMRLTGQILEPNTFNRRKRMRIKAKSEKRLLALSYLSVRPSIRLYQHCSQWTELLEI
jgi:hypothetical protein